MNSWKTFIYFAKSYPVRSALMVFALVVAGFLEGVGIVALLPLASILTEQGGGQEGLVARTTARIFDILGLELSIGPILCFIVFAMMLKGATAMVAMAQVSYSSSRVCADLRLQYLRHLLKARWKHFIGLKSGASANALGTEAYRASMAFRQGCYVLAWGIQGLVYALISFLVSWQLTLSAVGAGSIMVFILSFLVREGRRAGQEQTHILENVLSRITDTLYGAKPLKAMGKEDHLLAMMERDTKNLQSAQRRMELSDQAITILSEPIMIVFIAIGIYGILSFGNLPASELLFLALLFLRMTMKVASVQRAYLSMTANESALWSLLAKINSSAHHEDNSSGSREPTLKKGISFRDVSFSYGETPVLENISLELPARGFFVFCGPSGGGKTTLLDLLIGLLTPGSGSILIDGHPLESLSLNKWRRMIGYVPQDVLLFHDTVKNNVALNNPDIREDIIISALKSADALGFVEDMENGLETVVGERGAKLSGGQRQRIAIARAIVENPSLLILDEATSALDHQTEQSILETVKALSENILVLAISHNQAPLAMADGIFQIQGGKIGKLSLAQVKYLER